MRSRLLALRVAAGRREVAWLALIVGIGALAHVVDVFNYPFYQQDEGTYVSQAWSVFHLGQLAPYTYWYDHPPAGWIQLGGLLQLASQLLSMPSDIESGRVVMLLFQVGSLVLLYGVARGFGRSTAAATVAVLAFALSPYGLIFHRRVLLDNIATFWLLASLAPLVARRLTLSRIWLSAILLGVGVLSKEILVVVVPAFALLVAVRADRSQRWLATLGWVAVGLSVSSLWILFAVLKGELLPAGAPLAGAGEHVSLIQTLLAQAARGRDGGILQVGSGFWQAAVQWAGQDPLLVVGGTGASLLAVAGSRRASSMGALGLAVLSLWAFLGRGGETLDFYLVPLLPLLALEVAWAFDLARAGVRKVGVQARMRRPVGARLYRGFAAAGLAIAVVATGFGSLARAADPYALWTSSEAATQRAAIAWVRAMLPPSSPIVIDMFAWPDLQEPTAAAPRFDRADYYWKVEEDPAIRDGQLGNDWHNVDYVMATPDLYGDASQLPFIRTILAHSDVIRRLDQGGWPVTIERTRTLRSLAITRDPLLASLWGDWKSGSIDREAVVAAAAMTPAVVANAMLQAVYMNDRPAFDMLWGWAGVNLRQGDGLLHPKAGGPADPGADTDAAVALLSAASRWGDADDLTAARALVGAIWTHETAQVDGSRLVVAAGPAPTAAPTAPPTAPPTGPIVVDDSALAPYAYRMFAALDPAHPWLDVVDGTYRWLGRLRLEPAVGGPAGLVPHRVVVGPAPGTLTPVGGTLGGSRFDATASELQWRLGLDVLWNGEPRARDVLEWLSVPRRAVEATGSVLDSYNLDGSAAGPAQSVMTSTTVLPSVLLAGNVELAATAFSTNVLAPVLGTSPGALDRESAQWAWFATALMDGGLVDLTKGASTLEWSGVHVSPVPARPGPSIPPG